MSTNIKDVEWGYFNTTDFGLAVALICLNNDLMLNPGPKDKQVTFHFELTSTITQEVKDYWHNKLLVNPRRYTSESKALKAWLHENIG